MNRAVSAVVQPNVMKLVETVRQLSLWKLVDVVVGLGVVAYAVAQPGIDLTLLGGITGWRCGSRSPCRSRSRSRSPCRHGPSPAG